MPRSKVARTDFMVHFTNCIEMQPWTLRTSSKILQAGLRHHLCGMSSEAQQAVQSSFLTFMTGGTGPLFSEHTMAAVSGWGLPCAAVHQLKIKFKLPRTFSRRKGFPSINWEQIFLAFIRT